MVGSVGMVRGIARPNSLMIQEALNLLSAFGSDKKGTTRKLLTEMKEVQDHNEAVLAAANEAVEKANKREAEVVEKEAELARNVKEAEELYASRLLAIVSDEEGFQLKIYESEVRIIEEDEHLSIREEKLRRVQEEHRESIRIGKEEFVERERVLKEDRKDLKDLESSIELREEDIKSDRVALEDLRNSLDELKVDLDKRDSRVRAAMEGETVVGGE